MPIFQLLCCTLNPANLLLFTPPLLLFLLLLLLLLLLAPSLFITLTHTLILIYSPSVSHLLSPRSSLQYVSLSLSLSLSLCFVSFILSPASLYNSVSVYLCRSRLNQTQTVSNSATRFRLRHSGSLSLSLRVKRGCLSLSLSLVVWMCVAGEKETDGGAEVEKSKKDAGAFQTFKSVHLRRSRGPSRRIYTGLLLLLLLLTCHLPPPTSSSTQTPLTAFQTDTESRAAHFNFLLNNVELFICLRARVCVSANLLFHE